MILFILLANNSIFILYQSFPINGLFVCKHSKKCKHLSIYKDDRKRDLPVSKPTMKDFDLYPLFIPTSIWICDRVVGSAKIFLFLRIVLSKKMVGRKLKRKWYLAFS